MQTGGKSKSAVAATLQKLRYERDWSRAVLARRARLGISTIVRIETDEVNPRTGKVDVPKASTLRKLAQALGDGNAERTREIQRRLFTAAGYSEDESDDEGDAAQAIADLRARLEANERQIALLLRQGHNTPPLPENVQRLFNALPSDQQQEAIKLITATLERFLQTSGQ